MIHPKEKALLHIYADAAGINRPTYLNVLRVRAGVSSAADRRMTQTGFEQAMASLETLLFERVAAGLCSDPISGGNRWIRSEYYWRRKLPQTGFINSRQARAIELLWDRLKEFLPTEHCGLPYLSGIIRKATGRESVGYAALTAQEAAAVLDALRDRLAYAARHPRVEQDAVPF